MKNLLLILALIMICSPVFAVKYGCRYQENDVYYGFEYTPGETVTQYCKTWCDSDFWKKQGKCDECTKQDFPRMQKAYKSGACKKIMPPKVYNNVEGCTCKAYFLQDGTDYGHSCEGNGKTSCNLDKAMKKLEWMLTK